MEPTFGQFNASLLYCNKCGRAMPVREKLLLVLPDGDLYEYSCSACNSSLGSKTEKAGINEAKANTRLRPGGF
ncbi:MAG TPA: hypothetical protein VMT22_18350 [Terriglobales bacterium]|jgi:hypothetical protein|nr:hypothetical protein [Terriglobales bacterium]